MTPAPKPLTVDQLTADELTALEADGRIENGVVIDAPAVPKASPADPLDPTLIPDMPLGVRERITAASKLQSSFVAKDTLGTIGTASADGGKAALEVTQKAEEGINPDWLGKPKEDPVDQVDKMRFLAHLMGARFTKEYELFGGAVTVTFQTRTGAEDAMCQDQAWLDEKRLGRGAVNTNEAVEQRFARYHGYRITGALAQLRNGADIPIRFTPFTEEANPEAHMTPIGTAYQKFMGLPQPLVVALLKQGTAFESLVARMVLAADRPDFWKADSGS